jgi:hypothetical protein
VITIQPYVIRGAIAGSPLVYVHRLANGSIDYVGQSARGLGRPLGGGHLKIAPDDALIILPCASAEDAATLEKALITVLHPRRNVLRPIERTFPLGGPIVRSGGDARAARRGDAAHAREARPGTAARDAVRPTMRPCSPRELRGLP